jgi:cysteine synthase
MKVAENILDTIGDTPLIELKRIAAAGGCQILGKLEARNPAGSIKDRIGINMIRSAEKRGGCGVE